VGTGLLLPDMGVESVNHCCSRPISYQCYLPVCKSLIIDVVIICSEATMVEVATVGVGAENGVLLPGMHARPL
jgi:hypothetical protein